MLLAAMLPLLWVTKLSEAPVLLAVSAASVVLWTI